MAKMKARRVLVTFTANDKDHTLIKRMLGMMAVTMTSRKDVDVKDAGEDVPALPRLTGEVIEGGG